MYSVAIKKSHAVSIQCCLKDDSSFYFYLASYSAFQFLAAFICRSWTKQFVNALKFVSILWYLSKCWCNAHSCVFRMTIDKGCSETNQKCVFDICMPFLFQFNSVSMKPWFSYNSRLKNTPEIKFFHVAVYIYANFE